VTARHGPSWIADLEQQILLPAMAFVQLAHRVAHAKCRRQAAIRRRKVRHHRIADGLDHGAPSARDDLVQVRKCSRTRSKAARSPTRS